MFVFLLVSALLAHTAVFDRAGSILNAHICADVVIEVQYKRLPRNTLGTGATGELCDGVPPALAKCRPNMTDALITLNSRYKPDLSTILHEAVHGLGINYNPLYLGLIRTGYIGFVKTDGVHLASKHSVMNAYSTVKTLDRDTLYVLERMGYNITYHSSGARLAIHLFIVVACLKLALR